MAFKVNVGCKGKTFKVESSSDELVGRFIGDSLDGASISDDLVGYELVITGTSDKAGFAGSSKVEGPGLKKVLLGYGFGMHKKPKGEKKVNRRPSGLKLRKTLRGKEVSDATVQINVKVVKEGSKKFSDLLAPKSDDSSSE